MKRKALGTTIIVSILLVLTAGQVFAAPAFAVGEGTITAIAFETDAAMETTVVVTLQDSDGLVQTVHLSLESAQAEGLLILDESLITPDIVDILNPEDLTVLANGAINSMAFVTVTDPPSTTLSVNMTTDPGVPDADPPVPPIAEDFTWDLEVGVFNNLVIIDESMIGTAVAIDPASVLDSTEYGKVVSKVGSFFGTALGVDYATLQAYQDDGFGYGEIVQASWMAYLLGGDASTLDQILAAKESGDYSALELPEGTTATNWGQLRKAVLTDPKQNVGQIVSGKAEPLAAAETEAAPTETATDDTSSAASQEMNGNANTEKTNNGNANTEKTNNGNANTEKTNNGVGNTKDKSEKTNNGKKP